MRRSGAGAAEGDVLIGVLQAECRFQLRRDDGPLAGVSDLTFDFLQQIGLT